MPITGFAPLPAVQTISSESNSSPVERVTCPPVRRRHRRSRCTRAPRRSSYRTTQRPGRRTPRAGSGPMPRRGGTASSSRRSSGYRLSSEDASDSSSPKPSTPEKPPPTKVTVSSLRRMRPRRKRGRPVERGQHPVPDRHGLLDVLQPDRLLGDAGHGQLPGDRPGGDDDDVVADGNARPRPPAARSRPPVRVVDRRYASRRCTLVRRRCRAHRHGGVPGLDRARPAPRAGTAGRSGKAADRRR